MALSKRATGTLIGGAIVLGVFGYLIWGGISTNLVYFLTPTELLAKGPTAYGSSVRLGGMVDSGSVRWDAERLELRFRLTDQARTVEVQSSGAPPQMFSEGIGAVVEGVWTPEGVFRSHNLMVKHSNEYRAPEAGEQPAEYYRELFKPQQTQ
jgi:cytochrome c-type biogenesis protein CcmE